MSKKDSKPTVDVKHDRKAIYAGRRINAVGKVYQLFLLLPDREPLTFTGIRRVWIGYTYACLADKIRIKPERLDDPRVDEPEWEAKDALVDEFNAKKRAEAKVRKMQGANIDRAVEALRPLVRKLATYERRQLGEYLCELAARKK